MENNHFSLVNHLQRGIFSIANISLLEGIPWHHLAPGLFQARGDRAAAAGDETRERRAALRGGVEGGPNAERRGSFGASPWENHGVLYTSSLFTYQLVQDFFQPQYHTHPFLP
jgi:hypothetical protein